MLPGDVVLRPVQLDMVQRVFDYFCQHEGVDPHGDRAEDIASLLVHYFQNGYATEGDLIRAMIDHCEMRLAG